MPPRNVPDHCTSCLRRRMLAATIITLRASTAFLIVLGMAPPPACSGATACFTSSPRFIHVHKGAKKHKHATASRRSAPIRCRAMMCERLARTTRPQRALPRLREHILLRAAQVQPTPCMHLAGTRVALPVTCANHLLRLLQLHACDELGGCTLRTLKNGGLRESGDLGQPLAVLAWQGCRGNLSSAELSCILKHVGDAIRGALTGTARSDKLDNLLCLWEQRRCAGMQVCTLQYAAAATCSSCSPRV